MASSLAITRALIIIATFGIVALAVTLSSLMDVSAQHGTINLNGRWRTSDGQEVVIEQDGQSMKATFVAGGDCAAGEKRDFYIQGSLSGNSLIGTMQRCTRDRRLLQTCHLTDPYSAKITATVDDENTINGKYTPDYITYDCKLTPGGGSPTAFSLTRIGTASSSQPTSPRAEAAAFFGTRTPPIISIAVASTVDDNGEAVNPRFSFPATDPQITAIVFVGNAGSGNLMVTWYKVYEDEDGKPVDVKLFDHRIQVKSGQRAFSVAKNPGGSLEPGTYKVGATLEGKTQEIEFEISQPRRPSETPKRSHSVEVQDGQGARPVAGASGTKPGKSAPSTPSSSAASNCMWNAFPLASVDPSADSISILAGGYCGNEQNPTTYLPMKISATLNGQSLIKTTTPGDFDVSLNPCEFPKGSDLPGTKVHFEAAAIVHGQEVKTGFQDPNPFDVTLAEDTTPPRVNTISTPKRDSLVKPGDQISIAADVMELRGSLGSWQTGIKTIQIVARPGGLIKEWTNPSSMPQSCDQKSWEQKLEATYTVPNTPPPIIQICAIANDYAGNTGMRCDDFVGQGNFSGTWTSEVQLMKSDLEERYGVFAVFSFTLNPYTGAVQCGTQRSPYCGRARVSYLPGRAREANGNWCRVNYAPAGYTFNIIAHGVRRGDELKLLTIKAAEGVPTRARVECSGHTSYDSGGTPAIGPFLPEGITIAIPRTGSTKVTKDEKAPPGWSVSHKVELYGPK